MPRPNRPRSIASERNLADRIRFERDRLELTYEGLAKKLTEAGCAIQGSAIYRIEKGDPPRKISVAELVAFATVFEVESLEDLFVPVPLIQQKRAREISEQFADAYVAYQNSIFDGIRLWIEFWRIAEDPELLEFMIHQARAALPGAYGAAPALSGALGVRQPIAAEDAREIEGAMANLWLDVAALAFKAAGLDPEAVTWPAVGDN